MYSPARYFMAITSRKSKYFRKIKFKPNMLQEFSSCLELTMYYNL